MSTWTFDYAMEQARLVLHDNGALYGKDFVVNVLTPLIAKIDEREKNPGVWDGAPEWANRVTLQWANESSYLHKQYTRTLPKTKAREIAEKTADKYLDDALKGKHGALKDYIEAAILEAQGDPS